MKTVWRSSRGVLPPLILGMAILALLASSATAGNPRAAGGTIVCPTALLAAPQALPPGCCGPPTPGVVPCCPVPTAGCCVPANCCTATSCPQALSIAVTPDPAVDGRPATITGTLTGGTTVGAQPVDLWQQLPGQTAFTDVAQTQTSSSGSYTFVRPAQTNASWYAKTGAVVSQTLNEAVLATIDLRSSTVRHRTWVRLRLSGSVAPSHAGQRVALEQLRGRRWVTVGRPKLGASSSFVVARKLVGHARERFRIVLASDALNARSVSAVVAVTG